MFCLAFHYNFSVFMWLHGKWDNTWQIVLIFSLMVLLHEAWKLLLPSSAQCKPMASKRVTFYYSSNCFACKRAMLPLTANEMLGKLTSRFDSYFISSFQNNIAIAVITDVWWKEERALIAVLRELLSLQIILCNKNFSTACLSSRIIILQRRPPNFRLLQVIFA